MIKDVISNIDKYRNIPNLAEILKFVKENDIQKLPDGDIEIKGKDLYVKVLRYFPVDAKKLQFETHRIYADVHMIFEGIEKMQTASVDDLKEGSKYDEKEDSKFFSTRNDVSDLVIKENEFMVFFPGDAHKPGCLHEKSKAPVLKLVFKTRGKK